MSDEGVGHVGIDHFGLGGILKLQGFLQIIFQR